MTSVDGPFRAGHRDSWKIRCGTYGWHDCYAEREVEIRTFVKQMRTKLEEQAKKKAELLESLK